MIRGNIWRQSVLFFKLNQSKALPFYIWLKRWLQIYNKYHMDLFRHLRPIFAAFNRCRQVQLPDLMDIKFELYKVKSRIICIHCWYQRQNKRQKTRQLISGIEVVVYWNSNVNAIHLIGVWFHFLVLFFIYFYLWLFVTVYMSVYVTQIWYLLLSLLTC